jgi:hypothetical protein
MDHENNQERFIEYLYGEIAPEDKIAFKRQLEQDPQLSGDLKSYLQLRQLFHEHLPEARAPRSLCSKVLRELGFKKPWYEGLLQGYWQPALAGAFVLVLTLGISFTLKRVGESPRDLRQASVATRMPPNIANPSTFRSMGGRSVQEFSDSLLANRFVSPQLRVSMPRSFASNPLSGTASRVSLVGYGQPDGAPLVDSPNAGLPTAELQHLDMEADMAMAQFHHQQATRLKAMGEFKSAARYLARLIKEYPFYPLKYQAMAQRVDCLFRVGDVASAREELRVLQSISPKMAYLLEQRWADGIQY